MLILSLINRELPSSLELYQKIYNFCIFEQPNFDMLRNRIFLDSIEYKGVNLNVTTGELSIFQNFEIPILCNNKAVYTTFEIFHPGYFDQKRGYLIQLDLPKRVIRQDQNILAVKNGCKDICSMSDIEFAHRSECLESIFNNKTGSKLNKICSVVNIPSVGLLAAVQDAVVTFSHRVTKTYHNSTLFFTSTGQIVCSDHNSAINYLLRII